MNMKTREEVARFIEIQFGVSGSYQCKLDKHQKHHYGLQEARELMDFIYNGKPETNSQCVQGYEGNLR